GLEGGHFAGITKTHHAAVDGVSGVEMAVVLMDLQPDPPPVSPPEEPWTPERLPTDIELVTNALGSLVRQPLRMISTVRRTLSSVVTARRRPRDPDVVPPPAPFSAPRTSLNVSLTPHRRLAFVDVPL